MDNIIFIISLIGLAIMALSVPVFWIVRWFVKTAAETELDIKIAFPIFCIGLFLFGVIPMISDIIRFGFN